ncbi:MAG: hypothetical protein HQK89_16905 [Nitrospirae bacterium]|nr:hypothetical protein [Nitrospirota bacterium]
MAIVVVALETLLGDVLDGQSQGGVKGAPFVRNAPCNLSSQTAASNRCLIQSFFVV